MVDHGRRHVFISSIEGTFKRTVKHHQTEFDQSPAQACAIDLPELNYGL